MAGHSKWANIKHKKAAADKVKGKIFSKLAKEITIAARSGGGDINSNITLRTIVSKARANNMPADNIDRAIKKGTGEIAAEQVEEILYEGFASGGVSLVVQALSDNRNRTAGEVRNVFTKNGGNLATAGAVLRNYTRKGQFIIAAAGISEDQLIEIALDAGADDVKPQGDYFEVTCAPNDFPKVSEALTAKGIKSEESEVTMIPELTVPVTDKNVAASILKFVQALEELEDVQNVYANFDIPDEILEAVSQ